MTPRRRPTPRRAAATPRATPALNKPIPQLPGFDQLEREKKARDAARLKAQFEALKREDEMFGRKQAATRRAARRSATPKLRALTPGEPSTPPAVDAEETAESLLAKLRQENLEMGAAMANERERRQREGRRAYRAVMDKQRRKAAATPRVHSMRTKTGGKRRELTEGQITRVVNTFLDELTGGRKKKSRSNTRTSNGKRNPVGRKRRQRRR